MVKKLTRGQTQCSRDLINQSMQWGVLVINKLISKSVPYIAAAVLALSGMQAFGAIATIEATNIQDNTVAEGDFPDNSSGACDSIFAGNTDNSFARRALMRFDVGAQIPPGSIINSVTLTLTITRGGNNADSTMDLHPINAAWVEGPRAAASAAAARVSPRQAASPGTPYPVPVRPAAARRSAAPTPWCGTATPPWSPTSRAGSTTRAATTAGW